MDLKFKVFGCLCAMELFEVNGVRADSDDFGSQGDEDQQNAEDYACGNMKFCRKESTPEVLAKYSITETEYAEVATKLEDGLSFGSCGWCV
jgi:hypothetical protein